MIAIRQVLASALLGVFALAPARADDVSGVDLAAISPHSNVLAPRVTAEIPGARIGWELADIRDAFRLASLDGRPVVIVAEGNDGGLFANVLRCPTFNTLAGQAHFILIPLPILDETSDAARLINVLHMDPAFKSTVEVLDTQDRHVIEVARLTGYASEPEVLAKLEEVGLSPSRPNPLPLAKIALGGSAPRDCEATSLLGARD